MTNRQPRPAAATAAAMSTTQNTGRWLSHCIGCGCNDLQACYDEATGCGCHWLELDRRIGRGVCSVCADERRRWADGDRSFGVPVNVDDLAASR